jgi:two-component system, chemotaxis family, chemotaxis protein CheY
MRALNLSRRAADKLYASAASGGALRPLHTRDTSFSDQATPMQQVNNPIKDKTVVIADDDDITRELLRGVLRSAGLRVVGEASDGVRGLDLYQKQKPEIVCLDIDMPEMSGLDALKKIREVDKDTIVLMITGVATGSNVRDAISSRANGIIVKPFNTAKIVGEIERALTRRSASKA